MGDLLFLRYSSISKLEKEPCGRRGFFKEEGEISNGSDCERSKL